MTKTRKETLIDKLSISIQLWMLRCNVRLIIAGIIFVAWTLLCIYGTYNNTIKHAELIEVSESGYSIVYNNTGEIHSYE